VLPETRLFLKKFNRHELEAIMECTLWKHYKVDSMSYWNA
jgi:hypothetical protein